MDFLPDFPIALNGFVLLGAILLAGLLGGELAARSRVLPRVGGYIAVGLVLGPTGLDLIHGELMEELRFLADISLGLILFDLGRRLNLAWLRHDPWLPAAGLAEGALSFFLVFFALRYFDTPLLETAMAAAVGMATSPAVVLLVAQELGAEGAVTRRVFAVTAINNVLAILVFTAMLPFVHLSFSAEWQTALLHPLYRLAGSVALGYAMYLLARQLACFIGKRETPQFILLLGAITLAVGLAKALQLYVLLTLLVFGLAARNLDRRRALMRLEFGHAGHLFFVALFVAIGAMLSWSAFQGGLLLAGTGAFVTARLLGKLAGSLVACGGGLSVRQGLFLGAALTPMAGTALGMADMVRDIYPEFGAALTMVVVSSAAVMYVIGPVAVQLALRAAGEARPDHD